MTSISGQTYLPGGLPGPSTSPTALDAPYREGARAQRLMVQVCARCRRAKWPPEEICSACHSFEREWVQAAGTGTVSSWTRVWHPVHPALQGHGPYIVVVVELSDYPVRMVGNLLGDALQEVTIGAPVLAAFEDQPSGNYTLVQWERVP